MLLWFALSLAIVLSSAVAYAATLSTDRASFIHFPGSNYTHNLSAGAVTIDVSQDGVGSWTLRIRSSQVAVKPQTVSSERTTIQVVEDATGTCTAVGTGVDCELRMAVTVATAGQPAQRLALDFTTREASYGTGASRITKSGVPVDVSSGHLQLVATGVSPAGPGPLGGQPFYIVLSARLTGSPIAPAAQWPPPGRKSYRQP